MTLETIGIALTILIGAIGLIAGFAKWVTKKISVIAHNEITKSQSLCMKGRNEAMSTVIERIEKLENSDNETKLVILSIQKDLETLTGHHETTQSMILSLQDKFQDTTMQLIDTIKSITMKV